MKSALPNILEQSNSFISNFFLVILLSVILQTQLSKYDNQLYKIYKKIWSTYEEIKSS